MSSNPGTIFNVQEPTGADAVRLETTAAAAQVEAPNSAIAREVEHNAEQAQEAAQDAAAAAKGFYGDLPKQPHGTTGTATSDAADQLKAKTDTAVAEGQRDVQEAKATGTGIIGQAKAMAGNVLATGQAYLPQSLGGQARVANAGPAVANAASDTASAVQNGASTAYGTAAPAASSVASAAQKGASSAYGVAAPAASATASTIQSGAAAAYNVAAPLAASAATAAMDVAAAGAKYLSGTGAQPESTTTEITPPASSTGIPATTITISSTGAPHISTTGAPATSAPLQTGAVTVDAVPGGVHAVDVNDKRV